MPYQIDLKKPDVHQPSRFWIHLWSDYRWRNPKTKSWSIYYYTRHHQWQYGVCRRELALGSDELIRTEFIPEQVQLQTLLDAGKAIQIPLIGVQHSYAKDASAYGIILQPQMDNFIHLSWVRPPEEWRELVDWYSDMVQFLEAQYEAHLADE